MVTVETAKKALEELDERAKLHGENCSTAYFTLMEFISQVHSKETMGLAALLRKEADG